MNEILFTSLVAIIIVLLLIGIIFDCFSVKKKNEQGWSIGDIIIRTVLALGMILVTFTVAPVVITRFV